MPKFRRWGQLLLVALVVSLCAVLFSPHLSLPQVAGRLLQVRAQEEGIFLQISGNPQIAISRATNPDRIVIDLVGLEVVPELRNQGIPFNRLGVTQIRVGQNEPTVGRVVLDLNPGDPLFDREWQAFNAGPGTVLLRPAGLELNVPVAKAQVQGISLVGAGLFIQSDRPVSYRLFQQGNTYIVDMQGAGIADSFARPTLPADSPIQRIRLDEIGDVVRITIDLDGGWGIREGARPSNQINLQLSRVADAPPMVNRGRGLIIIDPGHGGRDPGAVANGIQEKDIVLQISLRLGRILQGMGYGVQYTRTTDVEIDLGPRVQLAERLRGDVFVSVHANSLASPNPQISGVETYYMPGSSVGFSLASLIHQQIISLTGARDRGVRSARFYVLRHTTMPSVLVETGFVTSPTDAANLSNPAYQERMAQAIARGIDQFLRARGR